MRNLRIHYLQHVSFEEPGYIVNWAKSNNYQLTSTKFYKETQLPNLDDFDWLIVLGGPMNVHDEHDFPWLKEEKVFIKSAIEAAKTVIGICLGSQLIANVLGANVYPNKKKEIGWFPIFLTEDGIKHELLKGFPEKFDVLHWHGNTFDLPKDATHLLQTDICSNQAFIYKERVLGLQFHLEMTQSKLTKMIENNRHEIILDDFVWTEEKIREHADFCNQTNSYLVQILNFFIR